MLQLAVYEEGFDDNTQKFVRLNEVVIRLEHSLVSLSKWEAFFEKPFLSTTEKTQEELLWYVEVMILDRKIPPGILDRISKSDRCIREINDYLGAKMSATWFREDPSAKQSREVITSEIIYYWMIALKIPVEFQHWHLNRLMTLVRICNEKSQPPKKLTPQEVAMRQRELNRQRQEQMKSSG